MSPVHSPYRRLPAVHRLLEQPAIDDAARAHGRENVMEACRAAIDQLRRRIAEEQLDGDELDAACNGLEADVLHILNDFTRPAYPEVINGTGVLIHTNLGRAPLSEDLSLSVESYLALEFDISSGGRGQRLAPIRGRLARLCRADSAVMVNNNAAALVLILSGIARGREVIVSRGQLIEIGGSFRLPDVMEASGCRLVEVGCTNRTHLEDYRRAITDETAAILSAHHSNFKIVGFTTEPTDDELAGLAHSVDLPYIVDQGSGNLHDLRRWGLGGEPTVSSLLDAGADVVCFSGDKLLGGPQAGIIVGSSRWVEPLGKHPLYRALRPDKTALVMMDHVLRAHLSGKLDEIPLYRMMSVPADRLARRARRIARRLRDHGIPARGRSTRAALGGGTTPEETVPSYALALAGGQRLLDALRAGHPPVVGRIEDDTVIIDLRTVFSRQDRALTEAVVAGYGAINASQSDGK
jgi:L-seryl-tRNA(Ser) seleniumtransferase